MHGIINARARFDDLACMKQVCVLCVVCVVYCVRVRVCVYVCCVSMCVCVYVCVCACVRPSQAIPRKLLKLLKVIIVKLGTVTAWDMDMHHVLITLTSTFIHGHTEDSRLKIYMTNASPMTLNYIQGHKCVSNFTF